MINELINRYPKLEPICDNIKYAIDLMEETYKQGGKIMVCGNGGSCSDSDHIVGELMKGFLSLRPLEDCEKDMFNGICENPELFTKNLQRAIPAISIPAQAAVLSAFCNDVEPELMYAQLVFGYGTDKDLLICLSTSGNSKNVVNAAVAAKAKDMKTVGMTGMKESKLSEICDCIIKAPETETYKVQEYHLPIYHVLCAELEKRLFEEK